jgi:hypothetical protein
MTGRTQDRPLSAQLAALHDAVVRGKQRVRECELAHRRAEADVTRLRDAVVEAYAAGGDARAAKANAERDNAEGTTLRDAAERLEGANRAVANAVAERGLFARENVDGLVRERVPDAVAVAQAVEQFLQAHGQWQAVATEIAGLLRLAVEDTSLPPLSPRVEALVRDARRAADAQVPPPLPGGTAGLPVEIVRNEA